ncbi:hypothetical protein NNX28_02265 [Arthrobacter sp. zg-Y859]|uniref:Uncharacterized protein n=1 Tax=Arthrobacter jinronghuae TaxID=2964609 RepID=A0ABT1NM35_9MICC|nr:hypothetical protein [Arthrobacter jinronghuae]MCQ1948754.1 hypothetical protein [Arthrobacter jinronghuae]UWX78433.1 hypothetical protein N2K98_16000 [Arthrobacter jinronghuae]
MNCPKAIAAGTGGATTVINVKILTTAGPGGEGRASDDDDVDQVLLEQATPQVRVVTVSKPVRYE